MRPHKVIKLPLICELWTEAQSWNISALEMAGNRVKFPFPICTADKSSTAQPPTAFSTARAHIGPSSACLQMGGVVLLCSAPLMLPSWGHKNSYLYSVAEDKSLQPLQGHRDWSWEGAHRHRGCMSFSFAFFDQGGANTTGRIASDSELTESSNPSYSNQQCPTKFQSFKLFPPPIQGTPTYLLPSDQEMCFHHSSLGLSQHNWVYFQVLLKDSSAFLIRKWRQKRDLTLWQNHFPPSSISQVVSLLLEPGHQACFFAVGEFFVSWIFLCDANKFHRVYLRPLQNLHSKMMGIQTV